jgi:putative ABC transport system permease protein
MLNLGGLLLGYLENRRYEYGIRQILGNRRSILIRELAAEFAPLMLASVLLASIAVNAVLHRGFPAAWKIAIPPTAGSTVWSEVLLVGIIGLFWVGAIAVSYLRLRPSNLDCSVLVHRTASVNSTPQLVLLAIEVALAVPLLQSALALDRSVVLLKSVNVGFDPGNVQSFSLSLPFGPYSTPQLASNFWTKLVNDLSQKRGIDRVGVVSTLPLTRPPAALMKPIEIDGARADLGGAPRALVSMASSGYFSTMHIPLVEGRFFQDGDGTNGDTPVLISKHLSQVLFGTGDPISRRIRPARSAIWSTIIGIVGDVPGESLRSSYADTIYFPVATGISSTYSTPFLPLNLSVVMRSPLPADLVLDTARGSLRQVDDGIPVVSDTGLVDVVANAAHQAEILAGMASIASCIMLGLTAMALYALIARATATRMREIGIRMALGAPKNQVIRIFLYGSLRAVLIGVSIGIVISVATGPAIRASLYRVSPTSFSLVMVTSGTIILFSFVAAYLPVRKAVQQDALTLLHDE